MKTRVEDRDFARFLRREGLSYSEIREIIGVSKATLSYWLRDIELTPDQAQRLIAKQAETRELGRALAYARTHEKSLERKRAATQMALNEFASKTKSPLFIAGVAVYWAEGAKTTREFHFMNSDPNLIRLMISWLTDCADIPREKIVVRVYVHHVYAHLGFDSFWREVTRLPDRQFRRAIFKPTPHTTRKNAWYMGCCRLSVNSVDLFWRLKAWQEALLEYLRVGSVELPEPQILVPLDSSSGGECHEKPSPTYH